MGAQRHQDHPADDFSQTILCVDGTTLKELRSPVNAAISEDSSEQLSRYKIRMATNDGRKRLARMLVQKMYATRGYETEDSNPTEKVASSSATEVPEEAAVPAQLTLVVSDSKEHPRGTMSMIFDTGSGLPADEIFKDLLDPLRHEGRRLIEVGRLAIDRAEGSKRLFAGMLHVFLIYATVIHRCTDWIIEVNPRHVGYYEKMMGWTVLSETRHCPRVGAPAVLLRIKLADMLARADAVGGQARGAATEKSLYPYFLSKDDARGMAHRLLTDYLF